MLVVMLHVVGAQQWEPNHPLYFAQLLCCGQEYLLKDVQREKLFWTVLSPHRLWSWRRRPAGEPELSRRSAAHAKGERDRVITRSPAAHPSGMFA